MSGKFTVRVAGIFALSVFFLSIPAPAQTPPVAAAVPGGQPIKIGIISVQNAISATDDGARQFHSLEQKFDPRKKELLSLNEEIEKLKKQLETQSAVISDQARADLQRQLDTKQKSLAREQEDAQSDFSEQQNEIVQKILQRLMPIIDNYAKQNGLGLVIDGSKPWPEWPVLWANSSLDITKAVVDIYNAQSGIAGAGSGTSTRQHSPATSPQPAPTSK